MTRVLFFSVLAFAFTACASDPAEPAAADSAEEVTTEAPDAGAAMGDAEVVIGEAPDEGADVLTVATAIEQADALSGQTVSVEGTVSKVCQMKGCWLTLASDTGETFRINVPKDDEGEYVFTFPMDVTGATAHVVGDLVVETESVEYLQHLAEDGGASEEEIAEITEPRQSYVLTAQGARLSRATSA